MPDGEGLPRASKHLMELRVNACVCDKQSTHADNLVVAKLAYDDMIFVPGGTFRMGSNEHYPEEAPVHRVTVDGFRIDRTRRKVARSRYNVDTNPKDGSIQNKNAFRR